MASPFWRFYLPETVSLLSKLGNFWTLPEGEIPSLCIQGASELDRVLKTDPPVGVIDLGLKDLLAFQGEGAAKKSNRMLECCPFPVRLVVDARPYVLEGLGPKDPDDWDNAGKQLAWRLGAQKEPSLVVWDGDDHAHRGLKILKESLELWADPQVRGWEWKKSREGGKPTLAGLAQKLGLSGLTCP